MLQFINQQLSRLAEFSLPAHCLLCGLQSMPTFNVKDKKNENGLICQICLDSVIKERASCQHCALPLSTSQAFCGDCLQQPHYFSKIHAVADYQAPFPALIKKFKYSKNLLEGELLAHLLARSIKLNLSLNNIGNIDYLIAVPLHPDKLHKRGFNQALIIALILSKAFNIPILDKAIIRRKKTVPQEGLSLKERKQNLNEAFSVNKILAHKLKDKHIAIIDDVVTTGATANSLCKVLLDQHIKSVNIWCICRTALKI